MYLNMNNFNHFTQKICHDLDQLRLLRGLSRKDLAEKAHKFPSFISSVFSAHQGHRVKTLFDLAEAMDADLVIEFRPRAVKKGN